MGWGGPVSYTHLQEAAEEPTALEQLEEEYRQLNDRYLRTLAEYDNFRKRSSKEREAIYPEAKADTVKEFLTVADSFSRALSFECADAEFKKGMEMIHTALLGAFQKLGVEAFGKPGETFDPDVYKRQVMVMFCSLPVPKSLAVTWTMPLASMSKVTSI